MILGLKLGEKALTRSSGPDEIVQGSKMITSTRAMERREGSLDIAIPKEIESPAHRIADDVGCQPAIECGDSSLIPGNVADNADGATNSR